MFCAITPPPLQVRPLLNPHAGSARWAREYARLPCPASTRVPSFRAHATAPAVDARVDLPRDVDVLLLDLDKDRSSLDAGTTEWRAACAAVRGALEEHGFFLVRCGELDGDEMFPAMNSIFDLPLEVKKRNASSPYNTYIAPSPMMPHYETMAVMNSFDAARALDFTRLLWPDGRGGLERVILSASKRLLDLVNCIMGMISGGYGVPGRHFDARSGTADALLRMIKYTSPAEGSPELGLTPHVDGNLITLLSQNSVHGLLFRTRAGKWVRLAFGGGTFAVLAGHALKAWSNGRVHPPTHQVIVSADEVRLSYGIFLLPKAGHLIEAPPEFVDAGHPRRYRPFTYMDFFEYCGTSKNVEGTLEVYAGITN